MGGRPCIFHCGWCMLVWLKRVLRWLPVRCCAPVSGVYRLGVCAALPCCAGVMQRRCRQQSGFVAASRHVVWRQLATTRPCRQQPVRQPAVCGRLRLGPIAVAAMLSGPLCKAQAGAGAEAAAAACAMLLDVATCVAACMPPAVLMLLHVCCCV